MHLLNTRLCRYTYFSLTVIYCDHDKCVMKLFNIKIDSTVFKSVVFLTKFGHRFLLSLVDRVFALLAGSRGFDSYWRDMSERFFRSNRPGYPHLVCSEPGNSGIRVAIGDCSVTEHRRWRPPYQIDRTVHVHANTL